MKMSVFRTVATTTLLVVAAVASFAGFPSAAAAESPDAYMQGLIKKASEGDAAALWAALPEKYQDDVYDVIEEFANKMDADLWDGGFKTLGKLTKVLKEKKEYVFGSQFTAAMPEGQKEEMKKNWDSMVAGLESFIASDLKTLDGLKEFDIDDFLKTSGDKMVKDLVANSAKSNPQAAEGLEKLKKAKVTLVSEEGDTAVLKFATEGEEPEETKFKKVDGKWLPADMVDGWDDGITKAKEQLKALNITPEQKGQFMAVKGIVDGVLDQLAQAKDQAAFDQAIGGVLGLFGVGAGAPPKP